MPINWDQFKTDVDNIIRKSGDETDKKLSEKIASISRMKESEILELFPKAEDAKKLAELMKIVNDSTRRNTKINNIIENAEAFAGIILTLLEKFV
jgi:hypothetical protein